jgi:hypothetical protein
MNSPKKEKKWLIEKYFTAIMNEKISGRNLASQEIVQSANQIISIFRFLKPHL